ncbi:unnamed protein product [Trichobilharzia szidati]|nr:unnamed protein product [Trichobilharzia szidati]
MASFDVVSLFTSIPICDSLDIMKYELENNQEVLSKSLLSIDEVIKCLKLCLESTYFTFKDKLYCQTNGVAMGSPASPIVANLYMKALEKKALTSFSCHPRIWYRYVDDTFIIIKKAEKENFLTEINLISEYIEFTNEIESAEGTINFLDCLVKRQTDEKLKFTIYRKPTHSNKYLNFQSDHPIGMKVSVALNLVNRARNIITDNDDMENEISNIKQVLIGNGYPEKLLDNIINRKEHKGKPKIEKSWLSTIAIPYRKDTAEQLQRLFASYNIKVYVKPSNSLEKALVHVKDIVPRMAQSNCVYKIKCSECDACYIGESSRQMKVRVNEHRLCTKRPPRNEVELKSLEKRSAIAMHAIESGHKIDFDNVEILGRGFHSHKERLTSEALHILTTSNAVNRKDGIDLSPIWQTLMKQDK